MDYREMLIEMIKGNEEMFFSNLEKIKDYLTRIEHLTLHNVKLIEKSKELSEKMKPSTK